MTELDNTIKDLNKKFGSGSIQQVKDLDAIKIKRISTGCYSLDRVLGGGLPVGRIIEIYGQPSSGKTLCSLFFIKEVQKNGGKAAFFDAENSFSNDFAESIGVNVKDLFLSQSVIAEDVLNMIDGLIATNEIDLIVLDSVASLVPRKEFEEGVEKVNVALQARIMSQALRKMVGNAAKTKTSLIFLNQTRQRVGVFFGNPETTPGGSALKFFSSIRLRVKKGKNIMNKKGDDVVGNLITIEASKNKTAPPFRKCELELSYQDGIDIFGDILDQAVAEKVVTKTGNTYMFGKEKLSVGREATKEFLKENPEMLDKINNKLKE